MLRRRLERARDSLLLGGLACACIAAIPAAAAARESVGLSAAFMPNRLGARATMEFGVRVATSGGAIPSAVVRMQLAYPANVGIANSGLGLETCEVGQLIAHGPDACPPDSQIGLGTATVEVPFTPTIVREPAQISVYSAPVESGELGMLLVATSRSPIIAQLVVPARLVAAGTPFGGSLDTAFPLVSTVPGGSPVVVEQLQMTIGPSHITYVEDRGGREVHYRPQGLRLPTRCPHGGFPFRVDMTFQDGTHATATTTVNCPSRRARR